MSIPREHLEVYEKLEAIFLPSLRKKRKEAYGNPKPETNPEARFVHYTSADAGIKIIQNKKIWLRNSLCMIDYREGRHGFDIFDNYLNKKGKQDALMAAINSCHENLANEAFELFRNWRDAVWLNTYLACVSEHKEEENDHGRLSMWRAFGTSNSTRVAIVIKLPWLLDIGSLHLRFCPVDYPKKEKAHEDLDTMVQNILENRIFIESKDRDLIKSFIFNMIINRVLCIKHEGFHEESEWRAIYSPTMNKSDHIKNSVEVINGIPQKIYSINLDEKENPVPELSLQRIIDRVIIGPSPYPWVLYDAFVAALEGAGVSNAGNRVVCSQISIRT